LALAVASLAKSFNALGITLYNVGCKISVFISGTGWSKMSSLKKIVSLFLRHFNA